MRDESNGGGGVEQAAKSVRTEQELHAAVEFLNSKTMLTKVQYILCCVVWAYVIDKLKIEKIPQAWERNRAEVGL